MPKYAVTIVQCFTVRRSIEVDVEAEVMADAVNKVQDGDFKAPLFDHPDWKEKEWVLQLQEAFGADPR